jgi:hypothetical protein
MKFGVSVLTTGEKVLPGFFAKHSREGMFMTPLGRSNVKTTIRHG